MKKVLLMFAVATSFLVSCGGSSETTSTTDSTQVVVDSTSCDTTHCDTTKSCCVDSVKVDSAAH